MSAWLKRRFLWSEGDLWTVGVGLLLATALAASSIPAALDARENAGARSSTARQPPVAVGAPQVPLTPASTQPSPPAPQPLLGPLVPAEPATPGGPSPAPAGPPSAPPYSPPPTAGPAPIPVNAVRLFAPVSGGGPGAVTISPDGSVHAATDTTTAPGPSLLHSWDAAGRALGTAETPDQPGDRGRGITGLAAATDGTLLAVDASTARVLRYTPGTSRWSVVARLPDVAPCVLPTDTSCQPGVLDTVPVPRGIAIDGAGEAYVADAGQGIIWRVRAGQPPSRWYASADVAGPEGLAGLAFDRDGHLLVAVTRLTDLQGTGGAGALVRIERAPDGSAGARTVVAAFAAGDDPVDIAVGAGGNLLVPLRGADALVILDSAGSEQLRIVDDALKSPTAVELDAGRVLVTVTGPRAAVLAVGTLDRPATVRR